MYVLIRNNGKREYLAYNSKGEICWTRSRLNAARFKDLKDALKLRKPGASPQDVGRDGDIILYKDVELQIYLRKGKWRFRIGVYDANLKRYHYCYGSRKGSTTPARAGAYGRSFVDSMSVVK